MHCREFWENISRVLYKFSRIRCMEMRERFSRPIFENMLTFAPSYRIYGKIQTMWKYYVYVHDTICWKYSSSLSIYCKIDFFFILKLLSILKSSQEYSLTSIHLKIYRKYRKFHKSKYKLKWNMGIWNSAKRFSECLDFSEPPPLRICA